MQATGYLHDKKTGEKILILVRQAKYVRYLKRRKSGKDGTHFSDEEIFLNEKDNTGALEMLKNGEVIYC
jgi:hypothetical protein